MQQLVLPILIWVSTSLFVKSYDFPYTAYLKESFERNFQDRCGKYPFVQQYVELMDNPNGKQIMFVYQEPRLKNGGLGDRIGGLISAVALALRFNRTLVMRDHSEIHKVFRPYHPTAGEDKYRWDNYQSWSRYNIEYANRDATEYDLWDCINNTGVKNGHCSMIDGDVSQPIILYRSNRAYLCYWHNNPNSVAGKQFNRILGYDSAATVTKEDLFEVAGCMLRLALWPTELLWQEVDKTYKEYGKQINIDHLYATFVTGATQSSSTNKDPQRYLLGKSDEVAKYVGMLNQPNPLSLARNLNVDVTANSLRDHDRKHHVDPIFYQVGLHFRCGDHNYVGRGGPDKEFCMYKPDKVSNPQYFPTGNPYGLAICAKEALKNHTLRLIDHHRPVVLGENIVAALFMFFRDLCVVLESGDNDWHIELTQPRFRNRRVLNGRKLATVTKDSVTTTTVKPQFMLVFVASDNELAAKQMANLTGYPFSLFSPKGCHVEIDPSAECHQFTVTQWFILSMSNIISTQTLEYNDAPTSSFSRYAGIYGLKYDPFRNGRVCSQSKVNKDLYLLPQSNWFC